MVEDFVSAGQRMAVGDFVATSRAALTEASERVRRAYGFPCGNAARSLASIEARAVAQPAGHVLVEGIEP